MTQEETFFIRVLADHIRQQASCLPGPLDWDALGRLAHTHQTDGIVYYQCKRLIPEAKRPAYLQLHISTALYFEK